MRRGFEIAVGILAGLMLSLASGEARTPSRLEGGGGTPSPRGTWIVFVVGAGAHPWVSPDPSPGSVVVLALGGGGNASGNLPATFLRPGSRQGKRRSGPAIDGWVLPIPR